MSQPTIKKLLYSPGMARSADRLYASTAVGVLVLRGGGTSVFWGDFHWPRLLTVSEVAELEDWMQQTLEPGLTDRKLDGFRDLALIVDELTAELPDGDAFSTVDVTQKRETISRRDLFRGKLRQPVNASAAGESSGSLPIRQALRSCLQQALLEANAHDRQLTPAECIAQDYGLTPVVAVPLHAQLDTHGPKQSLQHIGSEIASVGYQAPEGDPQQVLGEDCRILQRFVRGISAHLSKIEPAQMPHIHIDVRGGMHTLYEGNTGRILGALVGLEHAARPYPLRIENITKGVEAEDAALLADLLEFIRFRKINVGLALGHMRSMANAERMRADAGFQCVHIDSSAIGSLHQTIEIVCACRELGQEVLLTAEAGATNRYLSMLGHIALATAPAFVGTHIEADDQVGLGVLHREMAGYAAVRTASER